MKIDSCNTRAWAGLAEANAGAVLGRWSETPADQLQAAEDAAARALACEPAHPAGHMAKAAVLFARAELESALVEYAKVIELGYIWPQAYARMGLLNALLGRPEEALPLVKKAIRISPNDSNLGEWCLSIGLACFMMDQLNEAITWLQRSVEANPEIAVTRSVLASACSLASYDNKAADAISEYRRRQPSMTTSRVRALARSNNPERYYQGLRNAGLPE